MGVRNAKGEGVEDRQEARKPERGPWQLSGGGVRTGLHSGNGNGRHLCDGRDKTREQQDAVDKGEERTDCPSFKEYLKTQERWSESSCHSLRRVWTSAFWCYSFHFQTKRRPTLHFTRQNSSWGEARGPLQALRTPFRSQGCQPAVGGEVGLRGDLNPRWHPQPMIRNKTQLKVPSL